MVCLQITRSTPGKNNTTTEKRHLVDISTTARPPQPYLIRTGTAETCSTHSTSIVGDPTGQHPAHNSWCSAGSVGPATGPDSGSRDDNGRSGTLTPTERPTTSNDTISDRLSQAESTAVPAQRAAGVAVPHPGGGAYWRRRPFPPAVIGSIRTLFSWELAEACND